MKNSIEREKRDSRLTIYFSETEIEQIWSVVRGSIEKPSVSEWIRNLALRETVKCT